MSSGEVMIRGGLKSVRSSPILYLVSSIIHLVVVVVVVAFLILISTAVR